MLDLGKDAPAPDQRRALKNQRYNHRYMISTSPCNCASNSSEHWWEGVPALPVAESDVIVVGTVLDAHAFLSEDRAGIYSEYGVRVERVLSARSDSSDVAPGGVVYGERDGGRVRWPDGTVQRYSINGQGIPRVGARYALFLEKNSDSDYRIMLAYELTGGEVQPLDDGEGTRKYSGVSEASFLQAIYSAKAPDAPQPPN